MVSPRPVRNAIHSCYKCILNHFQKDATHVEGECYGKVHHKCFVLTCKLVGTWPLSRNRTVVYMAAK